MKNNTAQKNIPQGWALKKLSDVLDYERPDNYIVKSTSYANDRKTPVLTANKSFILGYTDENFGIYENIPAVIFDDFTTDSKFVDFPFKVKSSAIKILKCKDKNSDLKFVHERMKLIKFPKGNHKRYYISQYQDLEILLPKSKDEQRKIAEILGTVDEDIAKTQEVINTTEKLKKGLMQQLLKKGAKQKIKEVTKINPQQINPLNSPDKEFYYIDIASIKRNDIINTKKFYGKDAPSRARRIVASGDIIISTVRPNLKGYAYITEEYSNFLCSTGFCVLRRNINKIDSKFLYYIISEDRFTEYLVGKVTGSNYPAVNPENIGDYIFNLPDIEEQKNTGKILSSVDERISINKKLKSELSLLKKGLMQDLLSGKVRV